MTLTFFFVRYRCINDRAPLTRFDARGKNPENLRLAINLAKLVETYNPATAESIFDATFVRLLKRYPFALALGSARAYICALELMQHYKKTSDLAKVDSLKKFRDYFESRPTKPHPSATIQFRKNLANLMHSLLSIQTGDGSQLGLILTRTGCILLPALSSTENLFVKSGEFTAPLTVIHKDSQITLLKLNDRRFLRPINFFTKTFKTESSYFYAVVRDSAVSFCRHTGNELLFENSSNTWRTKRKKDERPGGFLFNSLGSLAGMATPTGHASDSLIFISAANLLTHIEEIGFKKIFKENSFPKPEYNFNRVVLPLQTSMTSDSTFFYVDVPQPGYYAVYAHLMTNATKEKLKIIVNKQHRSWTLKNLMRGAQWQPLIFDDQRPQGLSAIEISQKGLSLLFISKQIQVDSLFILNNFEATDKITADSGTGLKALQSKAN